MSFSPGLWQNLWRFFLVFFRDFRADWHPGVFWQNCSRGILRAIPGGIYRKIGKRFLCSEGLPKICPKNAFLGSRLGLCWCKKNVEIYQGYSQSYIPSFLSKNEGRALGPKRAPKSQKNGFLEPDSCEPETRVREPIFSTIWVRGGAAGYTNPWHGFAVWPLPFRKENRNFRIF